MSKGLRRREFIQLAAAGSAMCVAGPRLWPFAATGQGQASRLISPGCRGTKVKVARLFVAIPRAIGPSQRSTSSRRSLSTGRIRPDEDEFADVDFAVDALVTSPAEASASRTSSGALTASWPSISTSASGGILQEILNAGKPTVIFARPVFGPRVGRLRRAPRSSRWAPRWSASSRATSQLGCGHPAVPRHPPPPRGEDPQRDHRLIVPTTLPDQKAKFGTEMKQIDLESMVEVYNAISDRPMQAETERWIKGAARSSSLPRRTSTNPASWRWPSRTCWPKRRPRC